MSIIKTDSWEPVGNKKSTKEKSIKFEEGQIVEHKLNNETFMVLNHQGKKVMCRKKNLEIIKFYEFELKHIDFTIDNTE